MSDVDRPGIAMWSADPDPARTLGIRAQIDRALADGDNFPETVASPYA